MIYLLFEIIRKCGSSCTSYVYCNFCYYYIDKKEKELLYIVITRIIIHLANKYN